MFNLQAILNANRQSLENDESLIDFHLVDYVNNIVDERIEEVKNFVESISIKYEFRNFGDFTITDKNLSVIVKLVNVVKNNEWIEKKSYLDDLLKIVKIDKTAYAAFVAAYGQLPYYSKNNNEVVKGKSRNCPELIRIANYVSLKADINLVIDKNIASAMEAEWEVLVESALRKAERMKKDVESQEALDSVDLA